MRLSPHSLHNGQAFYAQIETHKPLISFSWNLGDAIGTDLILQTSNTRSSDMQSAIRTFFTVSYVTLRKGSIKSLDSGHVCSLHDSGRVAGCLSRSRCEASPWDITDTRGISAAAIGLPDEHHRLWFRYWIADATSSGWKAHGGE